MSATLLPNFSARTVLFFALLLLAGCTGKPPSPPGPPPPPGVGTIKPVLFDVQSYYEYNGYLDAVETVEIRARVKGYLNEVHFKEGAEVKTGDKLYTIDPRQYVAAIARSKADIAKAVADTANAKAQIKLAQADYDRQVKLGASAAPAELDKAAATVDSNKAQVDVAAANKAAAEAALQTAELDLAYTDIRSPIAGRISRTLVTPGNLVGQTDATLLTTIVSNDLYIYFDAPEKDFVEAQRANQTQAGAAAIIPVELGVATENGFPHRGVLDFRENRVDTGTGTVRLRGKIPTNEPKDNARGLYPGLYSRVQVPNGAKRSLQVIPEDALMTGQEGRFLYVIGKDNTVQKRTVTVGANVWRAPPETATPSGWLLNNPNPPAAAPPGAPPGPPPPATVSARSIIAIEKGLEPNDQIIVNGLQKARPGAPVTPEPWTLQPPADAGK